MIEIWIIQAALSIIAGSVVALLSGYIARINERQWWVTEEIYRPLLNEVDSIIEEDLLENRHQFISVWNEFDTLQQYRVDEQLRSQIQEYTELLDRFSELEFQVKNYEMFWHSLPEKWFKEDEEGGMTEFGGMAMGPGWLIEAGDMVPLSEGPDDFQERIKNRKPSVEWPGREYLEYWDQEYPGWEEKLWSALRNERYGLTEDAQEFSRLKYREIPSEADELRQEIRNRVEEGLFTRIRRQLLKS